MSLKKLDLQSAVGFNTIIFIPLGHSLSLDLSSPLYFSLKAK